MTRRRFDLFVPGIALIASAMPRSGAGMLDHGRDGSRHGQGGGAARRSRRSRSKAAPIDRYLRVTGSLMADAQAEVSAETAGRVIETPVERGTRVSARRAARPHLAVGNVGAAAGSRRQRRADRSQARPRRRSALRSDARARRHERQGIARSRRGGIQPHAVAGRPEGDLAERVRSASDAARGRAPEVSVGAEPGRPVVPLARGRTRARRAGAQGRGRHGRARAADRARRRAPGQCRRLRHTRRQKSPPSSASIRCASS